MAEASAKIATGVRGGQASQHPTVSEEAQQHEAKEVTTQGQEL